MKDHVKHKEYFNNRVVIITGGAGGLGSALTQQLLSANAKVVALDLNTDALTKSQSMVPFIENGQLLTIAADVTEQQALSQAIEQIIAHFGGIDMLINNAGITHMSCFSDLSEKLFDTIMAINFTASVNITRLCLPYLLNSKSINNKAHGGQIIAISSVAGFAPLYGRSAYSASKHAMEGFFRSLAAEILDDGIAVLIVSPAFVKSRPELTAKVNDGLSSPGAMKKNIGGEQLSVQDAAHSILTAAVNKQPSLYLGKMSKIARWLFALAPNLYMKLMTKQAKAEFE